MSPPSNYAAFLASRGPRPTTDGAAVTTAEVSDHLHPWQREIVAWAVRTGRAAIWADTGLGKTRMQIEWARLSGARTLILAPLAVCHQSVREAASIGVTATYAPDDTAAAGPGMWVTNYERLASFDPAGFDAVVLDEASILKQSDGRTRAALIAWAASVPRRLACTATPAPNDPEELTGQAEFLGQMRRADMLAAYFVHDADGWRLKGHGRAPMLAWMATWAVALRRPSDVGGADAGYDLPGLEIATHLVDSGITDDGSLFGAALGGVGGRARIRRETVAARVEKVAALVADEPEEPWLIWAGLNDEAEAVSWATGAVNVTGSMDPDEKASALLAFADGSIPRIVTKPAIASLGLNLQVCARMAFVGLSDSYEQYYQAMRRCYRYGQKRVVHAHVVLTDVEAEIAANISRKEYQATTLTSELVHHINLNRSAS